MLEVAMIKSENERRAMEAAEKRNGQ